MTSAPHLRRTGSLPGSTGCTPETPDSLPGAAGSHIAPPDPAGSHIAPPGSAGSHIAPPDPAGSRIALRRLLAAAGRVDDRAVARLTGDALETDGTLRTWQRLCVPALAAIGGPPTAIGGPPTATGGPATAPAFALLTGIRAALDGRVTRLARRDLAPTVMLAAPPGQPGDLPLTALAAVLLEHGVESWRLGAEVPWPALSDAVTRAAPARLIVWSAGEPAAELSSLAARHPAVTIIPAGPAGTLPGIIAACLTSAAH
ncbi:hypothetical protein J2S43_005179 [Catenuloplanes nepalensis]|uniref:B12-binding domain-containing protein n=1 Tax=Catenuloplanes nepalensis TaxID=587533 RepID=A0ABT9MZ06_9ACTN|nr:hypothetical protein [Catenuloplanes nepalensis]MDP9796667.1 hypothetical protein [Catenuloplanes nepalensis]